MTQIDQLTHHKLKYLGTLLSVMASTNLNWRNSPRKRPVPDPNTSIDVQDIAFAPDSIRPHPVPSNFDGKEPSFYVAKGWHNAFAGTHGANLIEAREKFGVNVKMACREVFIHAPLHIFIL